MPYDPMEILSNNKLFKDLTRKEIATLAAEVRTEQYSTNDMIVNEGDIGDHLYIIIQGTVRVFTTDKAGNEIVLARLEPGDYFGEQALLTTKPLQRNASVRALSQVTTLTLSHDVFLRQLQSNTELLKLLHEQGEIQLTIKLAKLLQDREIAEVGLLGLFSDSKQYEDRQVLFWDGDSAQYAYYLLSGSIDIRFYDEVGKFELRSQVNPGQFFGVQGIIENEAREGTAVANTNSVVFIVKANTLREDFKRNPQLLTLMNSIIQVHQIPSLGIMTQYQGSFLGQPAIHTIIRKVSGDIIVASRVLNVNIFAIAYSNIGNINCIRFEDGPDHVREIKLSQNRLVSIVSIGRWEDLDDICNKIYEMHEMGPEGLKMFTQTGKLTTTIPGKKQEDYICECMHVKYKQIFEFITQGIITFEAISKKTGVGLLCGGCRPQILDILNEDTWTYVKIINIRVHNDNVRSYQLQPINHDINAYLPGQHIVIEGLIDNRWVARNYTLTSIDDEKNYYEITVRLEPQGIFSPWIFEHGKIGTVLRLSDPTGSFVFYPEKMQPAVCFVEDIGITPAIAFVRKLTTNHLQRPFYLDYSVTDYEHLTFREEFAEWLLYYKNVTTYLRVTSEQGQINSDEIRKIQDQYPEADYFICGSTEYRNIVYKILLAENIKAHKIHLELFTHSGGPPNLDF